MKKVISLALLLSLLLSIAGCKADGDVSADQPEDNGGRTEATEFVFDLAAEENRYVENLIFNETVTIRGDFAQITFANCEFNADIINTAEQYTRVMFLEDTVVNGTCIIRNNTKEGTIETPLPKFITAVPIQVVCEDCIGAVIALGDFEIVFNDETYILTDSELFFDNSHPESGFVPYDGQEASVFCVGQWWKNGEKVLLRECEYDPNM